MSVKLYASGNYFYIEDDAWDKPKFSGKGKVEISLLVVGLEMDQSDNLYLIESPTIGSHEVLLSDMVNADGDNYDVSTWTSFYEANTNFNPATSASVAGVASDLADHESDDHAHNLDSKADLVSGTVPASQLPSYVDDVLEYANLASFPITGESGKIYIAIDTKITYRWGGSIYVDISTQDLTPYQLKSEKNQVSGYVGIDSNGIATLGDPTAIPYGVYPIGLFPVAKFEKTGNVINDIYIVSNRGATQGVHSAIVYYDRVLNKKIAQTRVTVNPDGSYSNINLTLDPTTQDIASSITLKSDGSIVGLGNISATNLSGTNTGDQDVSGKANLSSPAFTGSPTAPTQSANDNSQKLATTAYVDSKPSLVHFVESENTSTPNATVPAESLTAISSSPNADSAVIPKGTGAFLAAIPDGTTTGGNKRGSYATDLQRSRTNAAHVASANYATIGGGLKNQADGLNSTIPGGNGNQTLGSNSFAVGINCAAVGDNSIAVGSSCEADGTGSVAMGSGNTSATTGSTTVGSGCVVNTRTYGFAGGQSCTTSGQGTFNYGLQNVMSGSYNFGFGLTARDYGIISKFCFGATYDVDGDTLAGTKLMNAKTSDATPTTLYNSQMGGTLANSQLIIQNNQAISFTGQITGKQVSSLNCCAWKIEGLIVRGANASTTSIVISTIVPIYNPLTWGLPTATADTTNGGLTIQVTGVAATNIKWSCRIDTTEVIN